MFGVRGWRAGVWGLGGDDFLTLDKPTFQILANFLAYNPYKILALASARDRVKQGIFFPLGVKA